MWVLFFLPDLVTGGKQSQLIVFVYAWSLTTATDKLLIFFPFRLLSIIHHHHHFKIIQCMFLFNLSDFTCNFSWFSFCLNKLSLCSSYVIMLYTAVLGWDRLFQLEQDYRIIRRSYFRDFPNMKQSLSVDSEFRRKSDSQFFCWGFSIAQSSFLKAFTLEFVSCPSWWIL